jgi:hypothetical protein
MSKHAQQDRRTARISMAVTPEEHRGATVVALMHETDVSNLLRTSSLAEIMEEFHRIQQARGKS